MTCFLVKIFAMRFEVVDKNTNKTKVFGRHFWGWKDPKILTAVNLLSTVWQSLLDFRSLTAVCEFMAIKQNAEFRVGISCAPIFRRL